MIFYLYYSYYSYLLKYEQNTLENDDIFTTLNKSDFENVNNEDNSLEYDYELVESNNIWLVVLIMTLFIINYLYGYIINTTENIFYW